MILHYITAELLIMAENKSYFEDKGIKVSVSSPKAIKVVNDKVALAKLFPEYIPKQSIVHADLLQANRQVWRYRLLCDRRGARPQHDAFQQVRKRE